MYVFIILLAIVIIVFYVWFYRNHKTIKCNSVLFISGAPKTGKSLLSIYFVNQFYRKALTMYYIKEYAINWVVYTIVNKKFYKINDNERPLIYSNIPLCCKYGYVPISKKHLTREEKINDKSVMYLGEFSLVANSRLGERKTLKSDANKVDYDLINEQLLLFTKLCGHQFNGKIICDSQTISDVHYSLKRVLSNYIYIHHSINLLFHKVLFVNENIYSDDGSTQQVNNGDVEENLKWLLVPKSIYKKYDFRCYKDFTKDLKNYSDVIYLDNFDSLKANNIVSYVNYKSLNMKGKIKNE